MTTYQEAMNVCKGDIIEFNSGRTFLVDSRDQSAGHPGVVTLHCHDVVYADCDIRFTVGALTEFLEQGDCTICKRGGHQELSANERTFLGQDHDARHRTWTR